MAGVAYSKFCNRIWSEHTSLESILSTNGIKVLCHYTAPEKGGGNVKVEYCCRGHLTDAVVKSINRFFKRGIKIEEVVGGFTVRYSAKIA